MRQQLIKVFVHFGYYQGSEKPVHPCSLAYIHKDQILDIWPEVIELFFILTSAELEIYPAHK